jgi:hypothetical protein
MPIAKRFRSDAYLQISVIPVGANSFANAVGQALVVLNVPTSSRMNSLPQDLHQTKKLRPAPNLWELACLGRAFIAVYQTHRVKPFAGKPAPTGFASDKKTAVGTKLVGAGLPAKKATRFIR